MLQTIDTEHFKKLRRYKVYNGSSIIYFLVTSEIDHEEAVKGIKEKYKYYKKPLKIYMNGQHIESFNFTKNRQPKRVLDKSTGEIYNSINDFADKMNIKTYLAIKNIKTLSRYEFIR